MGSAFADLQFHAMVNPLAVLSTALDSIDLVFNPNQEGTLSVNACRKAGILEWEMFLRNEIILPFICLH